MLCNCLVLLFVPAILYATADLPAAYEECGLIDDDQFQNKQKFTMIDEFPWMARLAYNNTLTSTTHFLCQAVLIHPQYLITVALCVRNTVGSGPYAVLLGDWNSSNDYTAKDCDESLEKCSQPLFIEIAEVIIYPSVDNVKRVNDIALLRLGQNITYSEFIRPICLPNRHIRDKSFGSEQLILTSWIQAYEGYKQKIPVVVHNSDDCNRILEKVVQIRIEGMQMCGVACEEGSNFMFGAALMDVQEYATRPRNVYLVGLQSSVSFPTKCNKRIPSVFSRIDQYLDWIEKNIN